VDKEELLREVKAFREKHAESDRAEREERRR